METALTNDSQTRSPSAAQGQTPPRAGHGLGIISAPQWQKAEAEACLVGSLTSLISHEVSNPLRGIRNLIDFSVTHTKEGDPAKRSLLEAQKGLHEIESVLHSLFGLSQAGVPLEAEFSPLDTVIKNAIHAAQSRCKGKDVSVGLRLAPESPLVRTNDFRQIVGNLLANSFDAIASGKGSVTVETQVNHETLCITVEDSGCGIPDGARAHVFDAFWSTKTSKGKAGLGLTILKRITAKYGGVIEVKSEVGHGTRMTVTIPKEKIVLPTA